jgi:hypothetical protein
VIAFRENTSGSTAVELAIVGVPFFTLFFGVIEISLFLFTSQALEAGTHRAARAIRTGEIYNAAWAPPTNADDKRTRLKRQLDRFHQDVCDYASSFVECAKLSIDVRVVPNLGGTPLTVPIKDGGIDQSQVGFQPGQGGQTVIVRAMYLYPTYAPRLGSLPGNVGDGKLLIVATAAFENEPFGLTP